VSRRDDICVVLTRDAAAKIAHAEGTNGGLVLRHVQSEDIYIVSAVGTSPGSRLPVAVDRQYTALGWGDLTISGQWIRTDAEVIAQHLYVVRRPGYSVPFETFKALVPGVDDPGNTMGLLIVHAPGVPLELRDIGCKEFAAWTVTRQGVEPILLDIEPDTIGIDQLRGHWPTENLAKRTVLVVGLGSIGGVAAESLAAYGIGRLMLLDPDRLWWHNTVRHILGPESVGRRKVDALKARLEGRWPQCDVEAHPLDVVENADQVRSLLPDVDVVLCAADGIAPRRVVSHLARRAGKPTILACVLDNGGLGEILRLRPGTRYGCLLCHRAHLAESGGLDAEADQELDYGTGHTHRPMTAVGPDLHIVGVLAAKAAVATLLQSIDGDHSQRLPGEHGVIALRPQPSNAPPFDLTSAGQIEWHDGVPPRPNCPTCSSR
jgi:hypothetical protein